MNLKGRIERIELKRIGNEPPEATPVFISPGDDERMEAWAAKNPGKTCYNVVPVCGRRCPDNPEECPEHGAHYCKINQADKATITGQEAKE